MSLAVAYRPDSWEYVCGHQTHVASIRRLTAKRDTHAFLLSGESGLGKTTMARLIAQDLGAQPQNISEYDGSSMTGVDAWRDVAAGLQYAPLGGGARVLIVNECHGLSKQAWNSLLTTVEEPPAHTYWIFTTTERTKVPKAIETRCAKFDLKPLRSDAIGSLVDEVAAAESYSLVPEVRSMIIRECHGSPRQALSFLECAHAAKSADEASELIATAGPPGTPRDFAAALVKGTMDWPTAVRLAKSMQDNTPAETIRRVVIAYTCAVMLNSKSLQGADSLLAITDAYAKPFPSDSKAAEILLPTARLLRA